MPATASQGCRPAAGRPLPLQYLVLVFLLFAFLASGKASAQEDSGIYGVVKVQAEDGTFGAPIAGAVVSAIDENGQVVARAVSAENGDYRLTISAGSYRLAGSHPVFEAFDTGGAIIMVQERHYTLFNIGMAPGGAGQKGLLAGSTVADSGQAIPGVQVRILDQADTAIAGAQTDEQGFFRIELPAGSYSVTAEHTGYLTPDPVGVEITPEAESRIDFVLAAASQPEGGFQGLIRARAEGGAAGRPIPEANITAIDQGGSAVLSTASNDIGYYRLRLPPGRYRLRVEHPDYETAESDQQPLLVEGDAVIAWNTLLQPHGQLGEIPSCQRRFQIGVGSSYGERHTVFLLVRDPGPLTVTYRWSGDAASLALIVKGPDGVPLRVDGSSTLRLNTLVRTEQLAQGTQWEISIQNFSGGSAGGNLTVNYPCRR